MCFVCDWVFDSLSPHNRLPAECLQVLFSQTCLDEHNQASGPENYNISENCSDKAKMSPNVCCRKWGFKKRGGWSTPVVSKGKDLLFCVSGFLLCAAWISQDSIGPFGLSGGFFACCDTLGVVQRRKSKTDKIGQK